MGFTKYRPDSPIGRRLLAAGRDLVQHPKTEANEGDGRAPNEEELLSECSLTTGMLVSDGETEGVVRWRGVRDGQVTLGLGVRGKEGLVFLRADECKKVTKKGAIL